MKLKLLKKILIWFSYLFHPIIMPTLASLFYFSYTTAPFINQEKIFIIFQVLLITLLIPLLFFLLLRVTGNIDTIMVAQTHQRKIPLVIQCFLLILLLKKSIAIDRYIELHFFFLGALLSTALALILVFANKKASLHIMAVSSLTVFIIGFSLHLQLQNRGIIAVFIVLNGIIASSRLEMKAHTPTELIVGFFLGAVPQFLLLLVWL